MKFKYLRYKNIYSFRIGDVSKSYTSESCFSALFSKLDHMDSHENLNIVIYFAMDSSLNARSANNMCFLSKSELAEFFKFTRKITGIKFEHEFTSHDEINNACKVTINAKNYTKNQIKSLVSIIRCAYENPFSMQVKAAFAMKSIYGFKGMKFIDRFIIAMNSITDGDNRSVHSIYYPDRILINDGVEKIKARIIRESGVNIIIKCKGTCESKIEVDYSGHLKDSECLSKGVISELYLKKFKEVKKWKN